MIYHNMSKGYSAKYQYKNSKSKLDGQLYLYHTINGKVYLTPEGGKAKAQVRMPFITFAKAVKDGFYIKQTL